MVVINGNTHSMEDKTHPPPKIILTHEDLEKERERLCKIVLENERLKKLDKLKGKEGKKK